MNRYQMLWAAAALGLALHAVGLGWDAWMHANDPGLAAREGIFTLGNPSHLLVIVGVALASTAILAMGVLWLNEHAIGGKSTTAAVTRVSALPVLGLVAAGSVWLTTLDAEPHDHNDGTHSHGGVMVAAHLHDEHDPWIHNALAEAGLLPEDGGHSHDNATSSGTETVASLDGGAEDNGDHPHFNEAEFDVSPEHLLAAAEFYATLKAELAPYEDIRYALRNGYVQITPDVRGIAAHFLSYDNARDGVYMDPTRPEQLLYSKRLDGTWRLVGAMFVQPYSDVAPSYFGGLDAWHYHENRCIGPGGAVQVVKSEAECTEGTFKARTNWMLHVWTAPGAEGAFAHDFPLINPGEFPGGLRPAAEELGLVAAAR